MPNDIPEHFGKWLRKEIADQLISISYFARKFGICRTTLNRLFKQERPTRAYDHTITRVARTVGVSVTYINDRFPTL